ncbi:sensor histidine kinase [Fodinibius sp. Rm-B-1B1-1]|uniref:sensor histidine kinase n=1 Tax=Fodinibius alkaliphilus TaxID=3140241 RepID=UPI00315AA4B7
MKKQAIDKLQENVVGDKNSNGKISDILLKAIETTSEMVVITDAPEKIGNEQIIFVNKAFERITQYSRDEVMGKTPSLLQGPKTDRQVIEKLIHKLNVNERFEGETFNYKKDGTPYRVRWSIDPIYNEEGEVTHYVSVQNDLTKDWKRKQKMKEIIEERETLIKETHHRIKNNLATITGLLELQIMKTDSQEVTNVLSESMNRVQSIASIHQKLYQTDGLASIKLESYIHDLVDQLSESMETLNGNSNISFDLNLDPVSLNTRQAVPLGLILNELITNANKHAFEDEGGTISISCYKKDDQFYVAVSDNGKGLPDGLDISNTTSLGLKLIESLCNQLGAEYSFRSDDGVHFNMSFSID